VTRESGSRGPLANGIAYSQCWEDPASGVTALELGATDDVLVVTSGGCNVLALALEEPRSVTAIDRNPAQNHLLELKLAAAHALEHDAFVRFLGARPSDERARTYRELRPLLTPLARAFWDEQPSAIEAGVIHAGRFERYLALFRERVLPLMHPRARVDELLALRELSDQARFYERVWNNRRWRFLFRIFFGRFLQTRLGRHPDVFRYVDLRSVGDHYRERARHALVDLPVHGNYFLEYIVTGGYKDASRMPPYLLERNLATLRRSAARIRIVTDPLEEFLTRVSPDSFSAFYLSDVFEWMSPAQYERTLAQVARAARDGARVCYYNNLVPRSHPSSLDHVLRRKHELGRRLHSADRSFLYRDFVVETVERT
jgi:S-adenosylmethionine-diacylglycerol 3-amino-3-carboxypropyl transferase